MKRGLALPPQVTRMVGPAVCVAVLAGVVASGSQFWIYNLTLIAIYGIVVTGLNVVVGYAGQVSFAQTAFMAVGGYGVGILATNHGWNPWVALVSSVVLAALAALVIGLPLFRLRGHYLTMATFALAIGLAAYAAGATGLTGGAVGISAVPPLEIGSLSFAQPLPMLYLAAGCCAVAMIVVVRLQRSHLGRAWRSVASREDVAGSLGLRVRRAKLLAFVLAAVLGAVGGALYVEATGFVSPDLYSIGVVVELFVMLFIGGLGRTFGPLLGAVVVVVLPEELSSISSVEGIVFDLLLLAVILLRPQGLLGRSGDGRLPGPLARLRLDRPSGGGDAGVVPAERLSVPAAQPSVRSLGSPAGLAPPGALVGSRRRDADGVPAGGCSVLVGSGVTKWFGGVAALSDVSIELRGDRIHGLIGPNGAGKSTLLSILSGAVAPSRGTVRFGEIDLTGRGRETAARAGVVQTFQQASPIAGLSVLDNLLVGMTDRYGLRDAVLGGVLPRYRRHDAELRARGEDLLGVFGLHEWRDAPASALSFGQLRMLEIARACVTGPRMLLLDEPAAGLNQREVDQLREVIVRLRGEGVGVMVVDHDVPFLFNMCDTIVAMDFGRVIGEGAPEEIEHDDRVKAAYLGFADGQPAPSGIPPVSSPDDGGQKSEALRP